VTSVQLAAVLIVDAINQTAAKKESLRFFISQILNVFYGSFRIIAHKGTKKVGYSQTSSSILVNSSFLCIFAHKYLYLNGKNGVRYEEVIQ
jgi:hypothetical protein